MARTSRGDWLDEGLALLRDEGESSLTIEALCRRLKRTKGSYYHHFPEVDSYLQALLGHWEARQTTAAIDAADEPKGASAAERRRRLGHYVMALDMRLESAVRAWALRDPLAREAVARVDQRRIAYLAGLNHAAGATKGEGRFLAQLEYAAFVGAQQIFRDLGSPEGQSFLAGLRTALKRLSR